MLEYFKNYLENFKISIAYNLYLSEIQRKIKDIKNIIIAVFMFSICSMFFKYVYFVDGFVYMVILYYIILILLKIKNPEDIGKIIVNFLALISLYNILLSLNLLNMIEVSSSYIISNFIYFYISFLIVSFGYNFYEKILFLIDAMVEISEYEKDELIFIYLDMITILFSFVLLIALPINNGTLSFSSILYTYITIVVLFLILTCVIVKLRKNRYSNTTLKCKVEENENTINRLNNFMKEILNMEHIVTKDYNYITYLNLKLDDIENKKKCRILILQIIAYFFATIIKFTPLLFMIVYLVGNSYLTIYYKKNTECLNDNLKGEAIIELKNNNVLIERMDKGKYYLKEVPCKRADENFEIKRFNW